MLGLSSHDFNTQADTVQNDVALDRSELTDTLFHSLNENIKQCEYFALDNNDYCFDSNSSILCIHLNISSVQAHFDELKELLPKVPIPLSIIMLSETRINLIPSINLKIPGYRFIHTPSPTKAGGVGAYISENLNFSQKRKFMPAD